MPIATQQPRKPYSVHVFCFGVIRHTDFAGRIVEDDNEELAVARPAYPGRSWLLRARRLRLSPPPKAAEPQMPCTMATSANAIVATTPPKLPVAAAAPSDHASRTR